ncbi:regulatory particle non-ATPase [Coniothyrium glycines]
MSISANEERCNFLRQDLKAWEKKFAAQNQGRKAGRDDIKANAEISQKYKEYNKLRIRLSSAAAPRTPSKRTSAQQAKQHDTGCTPNVVSKDLATTPLKRKRPDGGSAENINPDTQTLSPQGPTVIGPTPQRDGIVLGLFDMLPFETPSKKRIVLGDALLNVPQTPSRQHEEAASVTSLESKARGERTPLSAGKRFLLNQFVTPQKERVDGQGTPSSTARGLATPAFLRRNNNLSAIDEAEETTPRPAPWKRRGLGRSLSAMIQAMKKDEDDRLDEEADIMRELEMEEEGIPIPRKPAVPKVLVKDGQAPMPLGPDRGAESDEDSEEGPDLGPDGKPRRAWKKKGLKRQTRRVIMRPNITKPKTPATTTQVQDESEHEKTGVAELQGHAAGAVSDYGSDVDDSEYASDASHSTKKCRSQGKSVEDTKKGTSKEGVVKTAARRIKATANANYRRLKIKGQGATGGKGRFSRRR